MTPYRRYCLYATAFVALCLLTPASGLAQQRYQPSRPTVSPYLNLFRENNGVIPNYQSLVRPQLEQQQFNQYQSQLLKQQGRRLQDLQASQQEGSANAAGEIASTGKNAWFNQKGGRAKFMNTSGYFSKAGTGRSSY